MVVVADGRPPLKEKKHEAEEHGWSRFLMWKGARQPRGQKRCVSSRGSLSLHYSALIYIPFSLLISPHAFAWVIAKSFALCSCADPHIFLLTLCRSRRVRTRHGLSRMMLVMMMVPTRCTLPPFSMRAKNTNAPREDSKKSGRRTTLKKRTRRGEKKLYV
jgi:hypothetical protein